MRFMMMIRATPDTEAGVFDDKDAFDAMERYNQELIKAGILLVAEGLRPSASGARLKFSGGKVGVTDGPFAETKELIAGFWIIQVADREQAMAWARRIPFDGGKEVELRQVYEAHDLPEEMFSKQDADREQAWRDATQKPITG